ncbi:MAG: hypothetical protein GF317_10300 [Candidatus Lokiarchaeota archaeon]|nr:hypothetical protein [Candidatus Lokiarchaeota archaeon]MBD3200045.1 hypothetical protein [Candidatus Lokiarchaeota archaeon]
MTEQIITNIFLALFVIDFLVHIYSEITENKKLRYATKPLLMPLLILYYIFGIGVMNVNWFIVLALIFSLGGDLSLMIGREGKWFMYGLGSFLFGQISYIIGFALTISNIFLFPSWGIILIMPEVVIAGSLYFLINDKMGKLKIPTVVYMLVISTMSFFALSRLGSYMGVAFLLVWLGSLSFIISDAIIAFDKFYKDIPKDRVYVMITYGLAQFLIVQGLLMSL